jgi:hypothetical protein
MENSKQATSIWRCKLVTPVKYHSDEDCKAKDIVAVKECKSNCNVNKKEVIKIVAEYKKSKYTCSD